MASGENRAEMQGGGRDARGSLWIYMTRYCCKPALVAVRPDWQDLRWIFTLSLWCLTPSQKSTSCHLLCRSQRLIQAHPLVDRGAEMRVQPGERLEELAVGFLQPHPGPWFLDCFITAGGNKKGE